MDTRVAVISIIVEDSESIESLNQLLYDARDHIIGRMGIPYREKKNQHHQHSHRRTPGHHQCTIRQDWPPQRHINQNRLFQCHHTHGG